VGRASGDQNRPGAAESKPELWRVSVDGEVADAEAAERDKLTSGESKAFVIAVLVVRAEEAGGGVELSECSHDQQDKIRREPIDTNAECAVMAAVVATHAPSTSWKPRRPVTPLECGSAM
jgi:hypothetical protein